MDVLNFLYLTSLLIPLALIWDRNLLIATSAAVIASVPLAPLISLLSFRAFGWPITTLIAFPTFLMTLVYLELYRPYRHTRIKPLGCGKHVMPIDSVAYCAGHPIGKRIAVCLVAMPVLTTILWLVETWFMDLGKIINPYYSTSGSGLARFCLLGAFAAPSLLLIMASLRKVDLHPTRWRMLFVVLSPCTALFYWR